MAVRLTPKFLSLPRKLIHKTRGCQTRGAGGIQPRQSTTSSTQKAATSQQVGNEAGIHGKAQEESPKGMEEITPPPNDKPIRRHHTIQEVLQINQTPPTKAIQHTIPAPDRTHSASKTPTPIQKSRVSRMPMLPPRGGNCTSLSDTMPSTPKSAKHDDQKRRHRRNEHEQTAVRKIPPPTLIPLHLCIRQTPISIRRDSRTQDRQ